ncbi:MAG: bile acid:sodium symporter family protein [Proteobacteria bacterium]|nr:MAG: bile acid:sodium symporter family protein [Pseudomonadota bacterium]
MQLSQFLSTALGCLVLVVMMGIGLTVTTGDLRQVWRKPKAMIVGLLAQTIFLPLVALGMCLLFDLPSDIQIGLVILAASPGGPSSNVYSLLAGGDVALNVSLTAVNNVIGVFILPLYVMAAVHLFERTDPLMVSMFSKMADVITSVILPIAVGMALTRFWPRFSVSLGKYLKIMSVLALMAIIAAVGYANWGILSVSATQYGWVILLFNVVALALGYAVPKWFGLERKQAIAIAFEIGIHNGSLALYVAITLLGKQAYAIAPGLYSVLMYFTAAAFFFWIRKGHRVRI